MAYDLSEHTFSVSEFLDLINAAVGQAPARVQGELTGVHEHQTGVYFSLKDKDDSSLMDCYLSPLTYRGLGVRLEDGMEAKVGGTPSIYKPKGRFSFRVETLELAGEGSLKKAYELLKAQLEAEGLFARKRPLPEFIRSVGIVTSRTGAVIGDFRKNLLPLGLDLHLCDVRVEGARAADQITGAVRWFNAKMPNLDVLAVMRGGGSLEDLQPFNNEHVARAVFASSIPTIGAIGHDRDVPIAALVSDVAVSTPTAAAVLVNRSWDRLAQQTPRLAQTLVHEFDHVLGDARERSDPGAIAHLFDAVLARTGDRVAAHAAFLDSVDPERNLARGYSIVTDERGALVRNVGRLHQGDQLSVRLQDGTVESRVENVLPH